MKKAEDLAGRFPIRELSARTQVNTVTLRAWERRYGLLVPARTDKGHRLYSEADVLKVETILALAARGVPLSQVKALLHSESPLDIRSDEDTDGEWEKEIERLILALKSFLPSRVEACLSELFLNYPAELAGERVLEPVFRDIREDAETKVLQGLLESELIRYAMLKTAQKSTQRPAKAQYHELSLLGGDQAAFWRLALTALVLLDAQYRVRLFACSLSIVDAEPMFQAQSADKLFVFYQDGCWTRKEVEAATDLLSIRENVLLCGTAPALAAAYPEIRGSKQIFSDVSRCADYLIAKR